MKKSSSMTTQCNAVVWTKTHGLPLVHTRIMKTSRAKLTTLSALMSRSRTLKGITTELLSIVSSTTKFHNRAGRRPTVARPASLFLPALQIMRRMALFATLTAKKATAVLAQSAGKTAQPKPASVTTVHTATSLMLTAVEPVRFISARAAKSGALSGTPRAMKTSIMSAAASALLTARRR